MDGWVFSVFGFKTESVGFGMLVGMLVVMSEEAVDCKDTEIQSESDLESYGIGKCWLAFVIADLFA